MWMWVVIDSLRLADDSIQVCDCATEFCPRNISPPNQQRLHHQKGFENDQVCTSYLFAMLSGSLVSIVYILNMPNI